jgi:hypothetical protein
MHADSAANDDTFEHGIDHCGYNGVAPIFCVGGPVVARDFVERDLAGIRGVSISQRGLAKGTRWLDLNLPLLFEAIPRIEYLRILFDDPIRLSDVGTQPRLRYLKVDCPKVLGALAGEMSELHAAEVRWSDECTARLEAPKLEQLEWIRPRVRDLSSLSRLTALRELDLWYARNFCSLDGLERLPALRTVGLHDCPKLTDLGTPERHDGLAELLVAGCRRFEDASAVTALSGLRKLSVYAGKKGSTTVRVPSAMKSLPSRLDLRGVTAVWI